MELIHQDSHDYEVGPKWRVERQPTGFSNPLLVRFIKQGRTRKLLDQTAEWVPGAAAQWASSRWQPTTPQVPRTLIDLTQAHMRQFAREMET